MDAGAVHVCRRVVGGFFFFKQKTAYEIPKRDWSSDVCSSDLDKPGVGADTGKKLAKENVNLLALLAFPSGPGKVQVDFVPENPETFTKAAKKLGLPIGQAKTALLVQGTDRAGALSE